jgi:futalosine hydrolase
VVDSLPLSVPAGGAAGTLLTTCAAAANAEEAGRRRALFPEAVAEDMEGFAVALACALANTPVRIVRGFSNRVGERRPESWRIPGALAAARELARSVLADERGWE